VVQTPRPAADPGVGISIGQVFLGKYHVDAILGQGGMGVVAKCTHLVLNDPVALKMLRKDVMLDRDAFERFMREAQAASKLRSEHVARVVDVGTCPDSGAPYMIMEFLDGHDLGALLEESGTLNVSWASMLMLQTAEALAEAHSLGIVHRDIKPTNLFVTWRADGSSIIKVLDFGISKSPAGTDMRLTQTQSLLGTPAYMSPEQMRSARMVDARTDIWSLGIVFYELLEGRRPFEADSFSEMCVKVAVDPPAPMTNTPPGLQPVVLRCLAKSPEQRYPSMYELGRDLLPFVQDNHEAKLLVERMQRLTLRGQPHASMRPATPLPVSDAARDVFATFTPPPGVPLPSDTIQDSTSVPVPVPVPRRSRLPLVIGLGLLAGAVGIAIVLSSDPNDDAGAVQQPVAAPERPPPTSATEPPPTPDVEPPTANRGSSDLEPTATAPVPEPVVTDGPRPPVTTQAGAGDRVRERPPRKGHHAKAPRTVKPPKAHKEPPPDPPAPPPTPRCLPEERLPSGKCPS
jgi:eukaryotic-like serine/threonine-protein kinase